MKVCASGTFGTPAPPAGPAPSSRAPVVDAVGTAALVLFGIGAMVAVVLSPGTVPAPPATVARPQEVVSDPAGTTDPEPAAPEVDEPVDAPVALPPRPPPSVPAGEVVIVGDADAVQLVPVAGGPERRPGAVPVGRYSVVAVFGGAETRTGLVIDVRSGVQVVLRCSSGLRNCAIDATPRTSRP